MFAKLQQTFPFLEFGLGPFWFAYKWPNPDKKSKGCASAHFSWTVRYAYYYSHSVTVVAISKLGEILIFKESVATGSFSIVPILFVTLLILAVAGICYANLFTRSKLAGLTTAVAGVSLLHFFIVILFSISVYSTSVRSSVYDLR